MDSSANRSSLNEKKWRTDLRNRIIQASSLLEVLLSGLVLVGLVFSAVPLIRWMPGLLVDGNPAPDLSPQQSGVGCTEPHTRP